MSTWRRKLCSPSKIPSGQKCYLCLRNELLPMCPVRTRVRFGSPSKKGSHSQRKRQRGAPLVGGHSAVSGCKNKTLAEAAEIAQLTGAPSRSVVFQCVF